LKILIVTPYLPHPRSGHATGAIVFGIVTHLAERHQVTVVSYYDDRERALAAELPKANVEWHLLPRRRGLHGTIFSILRLAALRMAQILRGIVLWQPYYVSKYRDRRMMKLIEKLVRANSYDVVQFEMTFMAQYARVAQGTTTIVHAHDVAYRPAYRRYKRSRNLASKLVHFIEWCQWSSYEPNVARQVSTVLCVTEQDRRLLQWLSDSTSVAYLPRGVDIPETIPRYSAREPKSLLFVGSFNHHPNVDAAEWLCEDIFPQVLRAHPDSKLYIVGPNPPQHLVARGSRLPGLQILGFVDDLDAVLQRCRVFIAPLRFGGGVKVKILQAMAHGLPVVTTRIGAEGITVGGNNPLLGGESIERLVAHIVMLFEHEDIAAGLSETGRKLVQERYSWDAVAHTLEGIYRDVLTGTVR
jgi:glycosyltransferase involved in cell wall biosynthesis